MISASKPIEGRDCAGAFRSARSSLPEFGRGDETQDIDSRPGRPIEPALAWESPGNRRNISRLNRAALLMDLQVDFLASTGARMPVGEPDASRVIALANQVLDGTLLPGCLPILVVNEFPRSDRIGNLFRHGAAIAGTPGSALDARIRSRPGVMIVPKRQPSAFTNPALDAALKAGAVTELWVLGVFAEACVRATAVDGMRRGYSVVVPIDGIGTNCKIKRNYAVWALRRASISVIPSLRAQLE